jgi:hypothetical protein
VVGEQGIEKSETGEGPGRAPRRAALQHPCRCWRERGASSARRPYMGRMDRATWIDRSILDVRNGCPWMGRSEFKHDDPEKGGMYVTDEKSGHTETSMSRVRPQSPM